MKAMISTGYNDKVSDVAQLASHTHRTSVTRFLSKSTWDETLLNKSLQSLVIDLIWKRSKNTNEPIYFIIDDTISEKTKTSSKAINIIQKCSFHNSHLKGKIVYGHQILVSLLSCNGLVLPYSINIYDKDSMSKIELASNLIKSLPEPINKGYVLCDSWYSSKAIFDSSKRSSFSYIGALKTNRVIFPKGHERLGIKLHKFAESLDISDFNLVTVKDKQYYIYTYYGNLKDRKNVSIILSYPKDSFHDKWTLKAFISLDKSLTSLEILNQYSDRWAIEPFFRDCKSYFEIFLYFKIA